LSLATACVLDFILHFPYVVDACVLSGILLSLSLTGCIVHRRRSRRGRQFRAFTSTFRL